MTNLTTLLKQWAELEPDRCTLREKAIRVIRVGPGHWIGITQSENDWRDYAAVQFAIQEAISRHKVGCILHCSAHSGWEANISGFRASNEEPAIAFLKAYLAFLKDKQSVNDKIAGGLA